MTVPCAGEPVVKLGSRLHHVLLVLGTLLWASGALAGCLGGAGSRAARSASPAGASPTRAASPPSSAAPRMSRPAPQRIGAGARTLTIWHNWTAAETQAISAALTDFATENDLTLNLVPVSDLRELGDP